jgi:hypothetical protein
MLSHLPRLPRWVLSKRMVRRCHRDHCEPADIDVFDAGHFSVPRAANADARDSRMDESGNGAKRLDLNASSRPRNRRLISRPFRAVPHFG